MGLDIPGASLDLATDAGTFSPSRIDPGTRVLLDALAPGVDLPPGDLVDVGAGYGPIALTLAQWHPDRTVWAVEVNERARQLCRENAHAAGLADRVRVAAPEEVPADRQVAAVFSNPPIRIGKAALHDLLTAWFARVDPEGEAWLVVQRHLGADSLARWIAAGGRRVTRVQSKRGYRVLRVTAGASDRPGAAGGPEDA